MIKMTAVIYAQMCRLLIDGAVTHRDIVEETGLTIATVRAYCKELHKQKLIYIAEWISLPGAKSKTKVWKWGAARDARKPPPLASSAKQHASRQRRKRLLIDAAMNNMSRPLRQTLAPDDVVDAARAAIAKARGEK